MRTSLNLATNGLLDGGAKPVLAIATLGYIRIQDGDVEQPGGGGGGGGSPSGRGQPTARRGIRPVRRVQKPKRKLSAQDEKRLEAVERKITVRSLRGLLEEIPRTEIDIDALERVVDEAFALLPPTRRKVEIELPAEALRIQPEPDVGELLDIREQNLRLLLLMS